MERKASGKILLHAETSITKELAEEINQAVGKIGPIHMAGLGLAKQMERTAEALKEGLEKIEEIDKEFRDAIPDDVLEAADDPESDTEQELAVVALERDQLKKEVDKLREQLDNATGGK